VIKILSLLLGATLLWGGCSDVVSRQGASGDTGSFATWAHYRSLDELVSASDLIVRARVGRKLGERSVPSGRVAVAFTEFEIQPQHTMKGQPKAAATVVQIGRAGDSANTFPEFPLLRVGSEVILFLRDVSAEPLHSDGTQKFSIVSPEGLYLVLAGRVNAASSESTLRSLAGKSVDEFEGLVTGTLGSR
jgi:hypothetical protein